MQHRVMALPMKDQQSTTTIASITQVGPFTTYPSKLIKLFFVAV